MEHWRDIIFWISIDVLVQRQWLWWWLWRRWHRRYTRCTLHNYTFLDSGYRLVASSAFSALSFNLNALTNYRLEASDRKWTAESYGRRMVYQNSVHLEMISAQFPIRIKCDDIARRAMGMPARRAPAIRIPIGSRKNHSLPTRAQQAMWQILECSAACIFIVNRHYFHHSKMVAPCPASTCHWNFWVFALSPRPFFRRFYLYNYIYKNCLSNY